MKSPTTTMPRAAALPLLAFPVLVPLPSGLAAQTPPPFERDLGQPLGAGDDTVSGPLALGFPFAFPDGTAVSSIEVDSNGRVFPAGRGVSDFTPSVAELLAGPPALCPLWTDLTFARPGSGDLYFRAVSGTRALVTWHDVHTFTGIGPFSMQLHLDAGGRAAFVYDDRVPTGEPGLVGITPGGGVQDPGPVDWSGAAAVGAVAYQAFVGGALDPFDLDSISLELTPASTGAGYLASTRTVVFARVEPLTGGCTDQRDREYAFTFVPNAAGGYDVVQSGAVDPAYLSGTRLGLGDDRLSAPLQLGFSFPAPGGVRADDLQVDSNGRLIETGSDASDFSESVFELLQNPGWSVCPLWNDLRPDVGGDVWFAAAAAGAGGGASVTWDGVPQNGANNAVFVQVRLFADGRITFAYRGLAGFAQTDTLVGVSPGRGAADPGEVRFAVPSSSPTPVVYEDFDVVGSGDRFWFSAIPRLATRALPVLGRTLELVVLGEPPNTTASSLLVGVARPPLDLSPLGLPGCTLDLILLATAAGTPGSPYRLPIPGTPTLLGGRIDAQPLTLARGVNRRGVVLGAPVRIRVGY